MPTKKSCAVFFRRTASSKKVKREASARPEMSGKPRFSRNDRPCGLKRNAPQTKKTQNRCPRQCSLQRCRGHLFAFFFTAARVSPSKKIKRRGPVARPELSGKAALFRKATGVCFEAEHAPGTEKGGLHPSGHGPPRLEGTGKAADHACSCKTLSGRLEHSFTPHHAFAGNIFFTPTRRRRPRYARSDSRPGQSDARRAFPCTVRVPPRKCP